VHPVSSPYQIIAHYRARATLSGPQDHLTVVRGDHLPPQRWTKPLQSDGAARRRVNRARKPRKCHTVIDARAIAADPEIVPAAQIRPAVHDPSDAGTAEIGPAADDGPAAARSTVDGKRHGCRGQATPAGLNWMLTRGPTPRRVFGTACSQVRWQLPPITIRSP